MRRMMLVLAMGTVWYVTPAADAAAKRDCGPKAAHTVKRSATIRVYLTKTRAALNYRACWRRAPVEPMSLTYGGRVPPDSIGRIVLRGRYLAYVFNSCDPPYPCDFTVSVLDVKRRVGVVTTDYLTGFVRTLVATRGGAAAFLAVDTHTHDRYVQKLDSLGVEEIDRGPAVHSLSLHGRRLEWMNGEQQRDDHIAHVRTCGPKGAQTEALSKNLRVYYTDPFKSEENQHYACLLGGGKPLFLGEDTPGNSAYTYHGYFLLRRDYVVWLEIGCYLDCNAEIHSADIGTRTTRDGAGYHDVPADVRVNERGFAVELLRSSGTPPDYAVVTFDSTGEKIVDDGPGIDPASIAIFADSVIWRHEGEQRSAPLH